MKTYKNVDGSDSGIEMDKADRKAIDQLTAFIWIFGLLLAVIVAWLIYVGVTEY